MHEWRMQVLSKHTAVGRDCQGHCERDLSLGGWNRLETPVRAGSSPPDRRAHRHCRSQTPFAQKNRVYLHRDSYARPQESAMPACLRLLPAHAWQKPRRRTRAHPSSRENASSVRVLCQPRRWSPRAPNIHSAFAPRLASRPGAYPEPCAAPPLHTERLCVVIAWFSSSEGSLMLLCRSVFCSSPELLSTSSPLSSPNTMFLRTLLSNSSMIMCRSPRR